MEKFGITNLTRIKYNIMIKSNLKCLINEVLVEVLDQVKFTDIANLTHFIDNKTSIFKFELNGDVYQLNFNLSSHEVKYGVLDPDTNEILTSKYTGEVFKVIPVVFSIMKHVVDEHNLKFVIFQADTSTRRGLYELMIKKIFPDFIIKYLPNGNLYTIYKK